jgi:hypothetical protein
VQAHYTGRHVLRLRFQVGRGLRQIVLDLSGGQPPRTERRSQSACKCLMAANAHLSFLSVNFILRAITALCSRYHARQGHSAHPIRLRSRRRGGSGQTLVILVRNAFNETRLHAEMRPWIRTADRSATGTFDARVPLQITIEATATAGLQFEHVQYPPPRYQDNLVAIHGN